MTDAGVPAPKIYPTLEARAAALTTGATAQSPFSYGGGNRGIGVTTGHPQVYLVFWGSQWGAANPAGSINFANDALGVAPRLEALFRGIGTNNETWSSVMTQYCEGIAAGSTSCPASAPHVGYATGGALAGIWSDTAAPMPVDATFSQLAAEAVAAAAHFGNATATSNRNAQYVIVSPKGAHPDGFNSGAHFCAWHAFTSSAAGDLAFTNLPYIPDMGTSCGQNFVNSGSAGTLDGVTMVEGHEYAETITDQNPAGGWTDADGEENADKCSWISPSRPGGAANVSFANGSFAMQATWSNETASCVLTRQPQVYGDFALSLAPSTATVAAGAGVVTTVSTTVTAVPSQTVGLLAGGLPPGFAAAFSSNTVATGGSVTFVVFTSAATPAGTYPIQILAAGPNAAHSVYFWLTVTGPATPTLTNGVWAGGITGAAGAQQFWQINVPAGQTSLQVRTINGSGNADLYVRAGAKPTTAAYTCRSIAAGTTETCTISNPAAGVYYVMVNGAAAYTGVQLRSLYTSTLTNPLTNGVSVSGIAADMGTNQFWKLNVPAGKTKVVFTTTGGHGDADLYVRRGSRPTTLDYKCRSKTLGNNEICSIDLPNSGDWYVMVRGATSDTTV